jgi:hypothetical protein
MMEELAFEKDPGSDRSVLMIQEIGSQAFRISLSPLAMQGEI